MLNPNQLDQYPDALVELYAQVEADILADMAKRIKAYDDFIPATEWQFRKLQDMGNLHDDILKRLASVSGKNTTQLKKLIKEAGITTLEADDKIYRKAGLHPTALAQSAALQSVLQAGLEKTQGLFKNLTSTTANTATKQFEDALDRAYMQMTTGAFSRDQAIKMAIKSLSQNGVAVIKYPSGHTDYLDVAVRRALLTGLNQTALKLQDARADEMGCDLVETSAHSGARPSHAEWQGKIFSRSGKHSKYHDFVSSTGYGTGDGLGGWNCRHSFYPFFEGLSEPAYSKAELKEMNAPKYIYNGIRLTEYEATQRQRQIERNLLRWKREYKAMEAVEFSTEEAASKITSWQRIQKDFLQQTGLKRQHDRESVVGFGKSEASKATRKAKSLENKANKAYNKGSTDANVKAYQRDQKLKRILQSDAQPKTIESGKQGKHILGHNNYIAGRSYLTISEKEAQELVDRYAGTGMIDRDRKGRFKGKELIITGRNIGMNISTIDGAETPTNRFYIHYSKSGTHIVPTLKGKEKQ